MGENTSIDYSTFPSNIKDAIERLNVALASHSLRYVLMVDRNPSTETINGYDTTDKDVAKYPLHDMTMQIVTDEETDTVINGVFSSLQNPIFIGSLIASSLSETEAMFRLLSYAYHNACLIRDSSALLGDDDEDFVEYNSTEEETDIDSI